MRIILCHCSDLAIALEFSRRALIGPIERKTTATATYPPATTSPYRLQMTEQDKPLLRQQALIQDVEKATLPNQQPIYSTQRMKCVIAALTIMILALTGNTQARENKRDVQEFLVSCTSDDPTGPDICLGFVGATLEALGHELLLRTGGREDQVPPIEIARCVAGITWGAARQAFINWARRHPENWSWERLLGVRRALYDTWPCLAWTPHSR